MKLDVTHIDSRCECALPCRCFSSRLIERRVADCRELRDGCGSGAFVTHINSDPESDVSVNALRRGEALRCTAIASQLQVATDGERSRWHRVGCEIGKRDVFLSGWDPACVPGPAIG